MEHEIKVQTKQIHFDTLTRPMECTYAVPRVIFVLRFLEVHQSATKLPLADAICRLDPYQGRLVQSDVSSVL